MYFLCFIIQLLRVKLTMDNGTMDNKGVAKGDLLKSFFKEKYLNCPLSIVNCPLFDIIELFW